MAKEKKSEPKQVLEREYIVPLRREWLKVPEYKRATKAVKALRKFIARHMKLYDDDLRKVKIDQTLNNEIRFRGMKKPPAKIRVKARKFDDGNIRVELVDIPVHIKFKQLREQKKKEKVEKKIKEMKKEEKEEEKKKEESEESKEKEEAAKEENLKIAKEQAKEQKHVSKDKKVKVQRKALSR
jgi:large subunit ribosomal protein L31e